LGPVFGNVPRGLAGGRRQRVRGVCGPPGEAIPQELVALNGDPVDDVPDSRAPLISNRCYRTCGFPTERCGRWTFERTALDCACRDMQIEMQDVVEKRIPPDADRPIRPEARVDRRNGRADSDSLLRPFATHPSSHECNLLPPANTEDADPPPVILGPVLHVTTALTREDLRSHEYDRPTERAQCLSQRHAELNLADPVAGSDESITGRCCRRTPGQRPDQQDGKRNYRRGAHAAQIMARRGRPVNNASEHRLGQRPGMTRGSEVGAPLARIVHATTVLACRQPGVTPRALKPPALLISTYPTRVLARRRRGLATLQSAEPLFGNVP